MFHHEIEAALGTTRGRRFVIAIAIAAMAVFGAAHAIETAGAGAAAADHAADHAADEAEIHEAVERFAESYTERDAAALADLFTEDALFVAPDGARLDGRSEIEAMFGAYFETGSPPLSITPVETVVLGDTAYVLSTYAALGDDGAPMVEGYGLIVLAHVDGGWMWHRHVANVIEEGADPQGSDCVHGSQHDAALVHVLACP